VDDQQIVWAQGFGFADPAAKIPATAQTVYRVGSVSKLFTDIAIMQQVERGKLDLDAPITKYLPEFQPVNPFNRQPITLRELMSHRAGLLREPPVGHYFDPTEPGLKATVESLATTTLVYPPGEHTKYSNGGVATVGYVLERQAKQPFVAFARDAVLVPMGLQSSAFGVTPEIQDRLAKGFIRTYHGRIIDAPTFQLGTIPAGSLHSTVLDLGKFVSILLAGGSAGQSRIIQPATLQEMWTPQFPAANGTAPYGLGFRFSELNGHRIVGHGGAIYGFATELEVMPDDKLGVVVISSLDSSNSVVTRIAHEALNMALAQRSKQLLPIPAVSAPIDPALSLKLAGEYGEGDDAVTLTEEEGQLFMLPAHGGSKVRLLQQSDDLIVDDKLSYGQRVVLKDNAIEIDDKLLPRVEQPRPSPAPDEWTGLIGEYGWDYDVLYILERKGKLTALIEWYEYDPLEQESTDHFRFPTRGLYDHEEMTFTRDKNGVATQAKVGEVVFKRRAIGPEDGKIFRITPLKPLDELRKTALAAQPPKEEGAFRSPDLVELTTLDPTIKLDIRYATTNDFLSSPMYLQARAFMQRPAAEALVRAHHHLQQLGYGLLIHDAYRPWYVTKMFWDATPDDKKIFVADPSEGSRHNRGCAVDLTLYDLKTGRPVQMPGVYDEFSDRSFPFYPGGTSLQHWYRDFLRREMEAQGFVVNESEWWHFDYRDWQKYAIGNQRFEAIGH
jgi:CubicO group peptidase (beta-lactamase class C family)/D-alanyl-D-alanine dipeptidase